MLMFFATLFTIAVTAVGVWLVKRTLDATLEAVEDTGKATDAMIEANKIAELANARARDASIAAEKKEIEAAAERRAGERRQLRAYVDFEQVTWTMVQKRREPDIVYRGVLVSLKNYGQTPADELTVKATFVLEREGLPQQIGTDDKEGLGGIMPNDTYRSKMLFKMPDDLWEDIGNETVVLVAKITAEYVDAFGDPHSLSSAYRSDGWQNDLGFVAGTRKHT